MPPGLAGSVGDGEGTGVGCVTVAFPVLELAAALVPGAAPPPPPQPDARKSSNDAQLSALR